MKDKNLGNTNVADVKNTTPDVKVYGDGDAWQLLCKASSEKQGWMKSTKVMDVGLKGCLVQVTTEFRKPGGGKVIATAEALTFCPGVVMSDFQFPKG